MNFKIVQALVVTAFLGLASQASALPTQSSRVQYYSDSSFTHLIGHEIWLTCSGGHANLVGQRSEYIVETFEPCRSSSPIEMQCTVDGRETYCPLHICSIYEACQ